MLLHVFVFTRYGHQRGASPINWGWGFELCQGRASCQPEPSPMAVPWRSSALGCVSLLFGSGITLCYGDMGELKKYNKQHSKNAF